MKIPLYISSQGKLTERRKRTKGVCKGINAGPLPAISVDRVVVPEFEIFANPVIRISEVKRRRFNIIDRLIGKFRITSEGKLVDKGTL